MQSVRLTWANVLTLLRFALIPHICYAIWDAAWSGALSLFSIAAITDVADGWCARWLREETTSGQYLDPIVDKLLMMSCYTMLTFGTSPQVIPDWFWTVIVGKETAMMLAGAYFWRIRKHTALLPASIGKCAMGLQVGFLVWILWALSRNEYTSTVCGCLLWIVMVVTVSAFVYYAIRIFQHAGVSL